jgi:hypothetical protein
VRVLFFRCLQLSSCRGFRRLLSSLALICRCQRRNRPSTATRVAFWEIVRDRNEVRPHERTSAGSCPTARSYMQPHVSVARSIIAFTLPQCPRKGFAVLLFICCVGICTRSPRARAFFTGVFLAFNNSPKLNDVTRTPAAG